MFRVTSFGSRGQVTDLQRSSSALQRACALSRTAFRVGFRVSSFGYQDSGISYRLQTRSAPPLLRSRRFEGRLLLDETRIELKFSGSEVDYTACYLLVISQNLCSKLHCQKGFNLIIFSNELLPWPRAHPRAVSCWLSCFKFRFSDFEF